MRAGSGANGAHAVINPGQRPDTVVLVGPMAAGKTSIGKRVAKALNWAFIDTDAMIVASHGPITEIFAQQGETEFRRIEADTVRTALAAPGSRVVSLGGGAVLTESTREVLREHRVVLLTTTQEAVLSRTNLDKRPLLRDDPGAWQRIFDERRPLYEAVADARWGTERLPKDHIAQEIVTWVRGDQPSGRSPSRSSESQPQAQSRSTPRRASRPQPERRAPNETASNPPGTRHSRRAARPAGPPQESAHAGP